VIIPALKNGVIVLCDRFTDSTIAYQGFGRGIDIETIKKLIQIVTKGLEPDFTFYLDISPEVAFRRKSQIIEKSKPLAAELLGVTESQLSFVDGTWQVIGTGQALTISEIVQKTYVDGQSHPINSTGEASSGATFPNGCHIAEVEIDPETGVTEIIQYTAVDDVGVVISPALVQGQIHGGIVQGIGQAFYEQAIYDASGQLLTGSYMDYAMPKAGCLKHITTEKMEVPTKNNALGSKGVGESGCSGSLPALSNAVINALRPKGITALDMPFTPAKVWQALQASE
jgi:carbon-monoxide dehydrogenase large subunit